MANTMSLVALAIVLSVNALCVSSQLGEYQTKCNNGMRPVFRGSVDIHFFSGQQHSRKTNGCGRNREIRLNIERCIADNYNRFQDLVLDNKSIQEELIDSGAFNPEAETYFFIHGFQAKWDSDPNFCRIKDLVLDNTGANFFMVDWSKGTDNTIDYNYATTNTQYVGILIGKFIGSLMRRSGQENAHSYHLIGHNMGAHIAGVVGYTLGEHQLGRITALDPSGQCFTLDSARPEEVSKANERGLLPNNKLRLSASSAKLVVVMHTDALNYGNPENMGHYDVFVNGGHVQRSCQKANQGGACSSNYAVKVLDTFAQLIGNEQEDQYRAFSSNSTRSSQCFQMAYTCRTWNAFRSGECGACTAGDTNCVHLGLGPHLQGKPTSFAGPARGYDSRDYHQVNEDRRFNQEEPIVNGDTRFQAENIASRAATLYALDRQYIMLSDQAPSCRYTYQVVIATSDAVQIPSNNRGFYLQINLGEDSRLTDGPNGSPVRSRLIRITNTVKPDSPNHERISREMRMPHERRSTTTYFTALITFGRDDRTHRRSGIDVLTQGWQLRRPLYIPLQKESRLWSPDREQLLSVRFVMLNYLSGMTEQNRLYNSYVVRTTDREIVPKASISTRDRPHLLKFRDVSDGERNGVEDQHLRFTMKI